VVRLSRRRREEPAAARGSLRRRLRRENPRHLSRAEYLAELRAQRRLLALAARPTSDVQAASAWLRATHFRGQRERRAWLGLDLDRDREIAAFEAAVARDAARRW
jgi:hypothetical protein